MPRLRLLYPVADDPAGAVLSLSGEAGERRAKRLIETGYAELVAPLVDQIHGHADRAVVERMSKRQKREVA